MSDRPDIEGLRALVEAMSPGPWGIDETDDDIIAPDGTVLGYMYDGNTGRAVNALRNAAPALLDHIARLEAALGEAIDLAEEGWGYATPYFRDKWESNERADKLRALLPEKP